MCIFVTFSLTNAENAELKSINNEEIQQYFNTNDCEHSESKVCKTIKDFLFSLNVLEKIQENNLILAYKKESTKKAKSKSDIKYKDNRLKELNDGGTQKLDYHDIQSKEIVLVTKDEYIALRKSMLRFCKNFEKLSTSEKNLIFELKWHKIDIFRDENFIKQFCKTKF
ncbi:hypothetical protein [Helicobacter saguini]|uniref:Uncharacterized protein n=1 Tax=Helicobacter saguini TaxID=1548018 RepID=A0A6L7DHR9_9HELI|nr:hypothetical protein [Helicobacter saguini]MWV70765.1 hypothetical protein [Helicobacter saguini]